MVIKLNSCVFSGFQPKAVQIEVDLSNQLPAFSLVGLASSLTQESRDRVRAAVCNSNFEWPQKKVTINLVPTDLPKWGSHLELPMALGVMLASAGTSCNNVEIFAFGELSLSGDLRPCGMGRLMMAWLTTEAQSLANTVVVCHPDDVVGIHTMTTEAKPQMIVGRTLNTIWNLLKKELPHLVLRQVPMHRIISKPESIVRRDFSAFLNIDGERLAKVAALVALADSSKHLLLTGPHGTGKSMCARAICNALGMIREEESAALGLIDQALGEQHRYCEQRSRRAVYVQSTATRAALEGSLLSNGNAVPGEMSRAHGGVLVMDEFFEFRRDALECLRQPLEEGLVRLQRARSRAEIPARFQLIATTNMCPCGNWLGVRMACRCDASAKNSYLRKMSGPLLDRFSMIVLLGQKETSLVAPEFEIEQLLMRLSDVESWSSRLKGITEQRLAEINSVSLISLSEMTAPATFDFSKRAYRSIWQVSRVLAALDGEKSAQCHENLALCLRMNLERCASNRSLPPLMSPALSRAMQT